MKKNPLGTIIFPAGLCKECRKRVAAERVVQIGDIIIKEANRFTKYVDSKRKKDSVF